MTTGDRIARVRAAYDAFVASDQETMESLLTDDFTFSAPGDVGVDRETYFSRWPVQADLGGWEFPRLQEIDGDEVLVTYIATRGDGTRFRNTEIHRFRGDRVCAVEVYWGWDLPEGG